MLVLGLCSAALACREVPQSDDATPNPVDATQVLFAGCNVIEQGRRCEFEEGSTLTLWAPGETFPGARFDTGPSACATRLSIEGGTQCSAPIPARARRVEVRTAGGWLPILQLKSAEAHPALREARDLYARGESAEAREVLTASSEALGPHAGAAQALLARITLRDGDYTNAAAALHASLTRAAKEGRISDALEDASALSFVYAVHLRDYDAARAVVTTADALARHAPVQRELLAYDLALLSLQTGDMRSAITQLREAERAARKVGLHEVEDLSREQTAVALAMLGDSDKALAIQESLVDRSATSEPCDRLDRIETWLWLALHATESRAKREMSTLADSLVQSCDDPWRRRNHQINAALLALDRGDLVDVDRRLSALAAIEGGLDAPLAVWDAELRGRYALAAQQLKDALAHFRHAAALADHHGLWENQYLARLGIGRSLEAAGLTQAAIDAYVSADASVNTVLRSIPLGEGRTGFAAKRDDAARRLLALLIRSGRPADALDVARRMRARVLSSLILAEPLRSLPPDARARWAAAVARYRRLRDEFERAHADAWQLTQKELVAARAKTDANLQRIRAALDEAYAVVGHRPDVSLSELPQNDGEVVLAYFWAGEDLAAFCVRDGKVQFSFVPKRADAQAGPSTDDRWLAPFRSCLAGAAAISVVAEGSLDDVDVHALSFAGKPLLESAAVSYRLDLEVPARSQSDSHGAVIVANPNKRVAGADAERKSVLEWANSAALTISDLSHDRAARAAIARALSDARWFHYAGHAARAGGDGDASALQIADGAFTTTDILTLSRAPERVVLSACESSSMPSTGLASTLGLAHAFLLAGSEQVIATARLIRDTTARAVFEQFYAAMPRTPDTDLAGALRQAQLRVAAVDPNSDWASVRVLKR